MKGETISIVATKSVCAKCRREIVGKPRQLSGDVICRECYERHFVECVSCGTHLAFHGAMFTIGLGYLCVDCRAHIRECEVCGTFQHKESMTFTNIGWICVPCFDRNREIIIKI